MSPVSSRVNDHLKFLQQVPLFSKLPQADVEALVSKSLEMTYKKGAIICKKNTAARMVFVIRSGTVSESALDENEFSIMIRMGGKGDCFGEMGVLLDETYVTTVVAASETKVLAIPEQVFQEVVWRNKSVVQLILKSCLKRLQNSANKSISLTMFNAEGRLAYGLMMILNESADGKTIVATQETISSRCGIARQTASGILNEWQRKAYLTIGRGRLTILDREALMDLAIMHAKSF